MRPTISRLALLAVLPLAACADLTETRLATPWSATVAPASLASEIAPEQALARLPAEAGTVVSVTERREKDRLTQTVALAGDTTARGANRIRVVAAEHDGATLRRMTEERIAEELAEELPDVDMRVVPRMASAGGVPLGLASGRARDGGTCIYGWQETTATPRRARGGLFTATDDVDLSVRVRLCRTGLSEEKLIALVEGLSLRADVVPRGTFAATGPTGVDALATAGYGGGAIDRTSPVATAPRLGARTEDAPVVRPRPVRAASPAPVVTPAVPPPRSTSVSPAPRVPATTPPPVPATAAAPGLVSPPIPLPSGG